MLLLSVFIYCSLCLLFLFYGPRVSNKRIHSFIYLFIHSFRYISVVSATAINCLERYDSVIPRYTGWSIKADTHTVSRVSAFLDHPVCRVGRWTLISQWVRNDTNNTLFWPGNRPYFLLTLTSCSSPFPPLPTHIHPAVKSPAGRPPYQ